MIIDHERIVRWNTTDRYFAIEADGSPVSGPYLGPWARGRKVALQRTEHSGYGVYDAKERKLIREPDTQRRAERLTQEAESLEAQAQAKREIVAQIS